MTPQAKDDVRYLIFDIESVADANLVAEMRHPNEDVTPEEALRLYRDELIEKKGTDFVPYTYQIPVSLALAKVSRDYTLLDMKVLKYEDGGAKGICERFWSGWTYYNRPTFVTFNGRGFDVPLMELTAFRYGVPIPEWFSIGAKQYDQPRNRFNLGNHLDLCELVSNFGAVSVSGGLNILSKIIKRPGKIETKGEMVQDMFDAGSLKEIHDYCRCDVLDTYFIFLRSMLLLGKISPQREQELTEQTKAFLESQANEVDGYRIYLDAWKKCDPAFVESAPAALPVTSEEPSKESSDELPEEPPEEMSEAEPFPL